MCLFQRNRGPSLAECSSRHTQGRPSHGGTLSSVSRGTDGSRWAPTLTLAEKTDTLEQRLGHTRCEAAAHLGANTGRHRERNGGGGPQPFPQGHSSRCPEAHGGTSTNTHGCPATPTQAKTQSAGPLPHTHTTF